MSLSSDMREEPPTCRQVGDRRRRARLLDSTFGCRIDVLGILNDQRIQEAWILETLSLDLREYDVESNTPRSTESDTRCLNLVQ